MNIKNISTINCNDGDILAYDVYSVNGNALLVAKETILNGFLKEHLYNLGIKNVSIYKQENSITKKKRLLHGFFGNLYKYDHIYKKDIS